MFKILKRGSNNSDLALELFSTLGIGKNSELSPKATNILRQCSHRTDVLKEMINLCQNPATPKELYIVSTAYVWLGASYRQLAIEYLNKYINVGAYWDGFPSGDIDLFGYEENQKDLNIARVYYDLGQCYEKEYMLSEAIIAYSTASKYEPHFAYYKVCVSNVYVKLGEYNHAIVNLINARNSKYYTTYTYKTSDGVVHVNKDYINAIDSAMIDVEKKQKRGYKYKPKPMRN
ncbi:MAG TPA: hypothetical protein VN258_05370 [Mobilitalea sp.]|nr:hypothetical protein [Mobilitalea sp.]